MNIMFAYRVVSTRLPDEYPVGKIICIADDEGRYWEPQRLNFPTMSIEQYMRCRRLGKITARTQRGATRQINALLRAAGYKQRLPQAKAGKAMRAPR